MTDPVNRTMLLVDIEKFSERDDVEQAFLRRMLYDAVDSTLERAGIEETLRLRADQGDCLMEFIDPNASVTRLLRTLLRELPGYLRSLNRTASSSAQIRLRAVLASGYIWRDERGIWVGSDLNHACRLLDANLLRDALRRSADDLALCVSESLYQGIIRHDHEGIPTAKFHAVTLDSKNGPLSAWLYGPRPEDSSPSTGTDATTAPTTRPGGNPQPPAAGASGERPAPQRTEGARHQSAGHPTVFRFEGGAPSFGGSLVGGDQHGVSGGTVHGDVVMGGQNPLPEVADGDQE